MRLVYIVYTLFIELVLFSFSFFHSSLRTLYQADIYKLYTKKWISSALGTKQSPALSLSSSHPKHCCEIPGPWSLLDGQVLIVPSTFYIQYILRSLRKSLKLLPKSNLIEQIQEKQYYQLSH